MNLRSGRDIRAERMRLGVAIEWLAKNAPVPIGDLRVIERRNLPLSQEIIDNVTRALESVSRAAA
jgi:hypothetical protein